MRVTTTTTSGLINSPIAPIKMSSLVAPPIGAFGTNQGTLGVQVNNRDGAASQGSRSRSPALRTSPTRPTRRLRDLRLRPRRQLHRPASTSPAGSTRAATHRQRRRDRQPTARSTSRRSTYDRAASVPVTLRHRDRSAAAVVAANVIAARRVQRRRALGPVLARSPACASSNPPAPPTPRSPPPTCSRSPTATASTAAAARRRPDERTITQLLRRLNPGDYIDIDPAWRRPRSRCGCPSINLRVLCNGAADPADQPVEHRRHVEEPRLQEKFIYAATLAAPATDVERLDARPRPCRSATTTVCVDALGRSRRPDHQVAHRSDGNVQNRFSEGIKPPAPRSARLPGRQPDDRPRQRRAPPGRARHDPRALRGRRDAASSCMIAMLIGMMTADRGRSPSSTLGEAVQRRRRPRQRDPARAPRDGHDHAPAALAGLLQPDRAGARQRHRHAVKFHADLSDGRG